MPDPFAASRRDLLYHDHALHEFIERDFSVPAGSPRQHHWWAPATRGRSMRAR